MRTGRLRLPVSIIVLAAVLGVGIPGWPQGLTQLPPGGPDPNRLKAGKLEWSLYEAVQNTAGARQNYFGGATDTALVEVELAGPATAAQRQMLERHGAKVLKVWGSTAFVRAGFDRLAEVGDLPFVRFLRRPRAPRPDQRAFEPWSPDNLPERLPGAAGGRTVTIGIIDNFDFKHLPDQIAGKSTACRYNVVVNTEPEMHGNIVTEVVARMTANVPSIQLCLYPAGTAHELRDIVAHAAAHHVDVLTNSMTFFDEFDFFDGRSQLAQDISRGLGSQIVFVVSSGNYGDSHYWGTFANAADRRWHQFASGQETLSLRIDGTVALWLNWNSWRGPGGMAQSLDLFLYSEDLKAEVARSTTSAEDEFYQAIERENLHGVYKVVIKNSSLRVRPVAFHLFVLENARVGPGDQRLLSERRSLAGVVQPIDNVIAVGAAQYSRGQIWPYSSQGPTGDDRAKPDLVGYSPVPSDLNGKVMHGTSFTAPQVAAAAALLRAKNPGLSAAEIKRILLQSASPVILSPLLGTGDAYGAGILNVRRAFESALVFPAMPDGARGMFLFHP